ncbi:hypothetical protein GOP47_0012751 [Adiantum capillus-veneris]|uniref:START domain-containing protein n=1 Tax=Adiantum capillus-veneris TaxID=13818 RepID=A0A9D4URA0_ADICA|nr:hypothetical protein GOP47_0012751 [Adiantum capillus-veneris]
MTVIEGRQRLEATLSSAALTDKDNVYRMVASRLAASSSPSPSVSSSSSSASPISSTSLHTDNSVAEGNHIHEIVRSRFEQVWSLLELLRSASGEANHNLTIMADKDISSEGWKLKHDTGQLRVMYCEGPKGTPFHTLLAEGLIYSSITNALCLAWEAPSYNLWWPQMTVPPFKLIESRWVKRGFNGEDISLIRVKVPWPLAAREVLMCAFELEVLGEELIIVLLHSFPDTEESICGHKPSEIPDALPDVVRMELAGGFALQKVNQGQSYFRTIANLDIKLDLVPPWLINFMSRQLIGLGFKLYQNTLISINKGEGSSRHFQKLLETEPMYERLRKGLESRKGESFGEQQVMPHKRPSDTEASKVSKSSKMDEKAESSGSASVSNAEEIVPVLAEEGGSSSYDRTNDATGLASCDAGASVDPEVQKALNVLDQMIALVQSRKVGSSTAASTVDNASIPSKSGTFYSTLSQSVNIHYSEAVHMNQDEHLSTVAPLQQSVDREEPPPSHQTSQVEPHQKWFCIHSSHFCCGYK